MFDVLDKLIGPLSAHITALLSQAASGTDEMRAQSDTKKAYLGLLVVIVSSQLEGVFTSERTCYFLLTPPHCLKYPAGNSATFEALLGSMLGIAEDLSDTGCQKAALSFFSRCITVWGQPASQPGSATNGEAASTGLPGFERFIYEQVVPTVFSVPSSSKFNMKDGQNVVVRLTFFHRCRSPN